MSVQIHASEWLNTPAPIDLSTLRGRIVLLLAFQMHCPGCVIQAVPQAQRVRASFREDEVAVIGLHSVFENHAEAAPERLRDFVTEHQLSFPIAVDAARLDHPVPRTMRALQLPGTPTTVLFDRQGRLRLRRFGHLDDLRLGAMLGQLLSEPSAANAS